MLKPVLLLLVAYLIGSIPFPVIVSRLAKGIDLREHGSGNMGATNAGRVLGKRWFPVVLALDLSKGALATWMVATLLPLWAGADPVLAAALGGLAVVVGHCFPVFAGFRGGVGLAASAGAMLVLSPALMVSVALSLVLVWLVSRDMYVGTAGAALLYPALGWYWLGSGSVVAVMAAWGLLVFALHLKDLKAWLAARRGN